MIQVWNSYLHDIIYSTATPSTSQEHLNTHNLGKLLKVGRMCNGIVYVLDAASQAEALYMLHKIRELREQHTTTLQPVMNQIYHTLSMLHYVLDDYTDVSAILECSCTKTG